MNRMDEWINTAEAARLLLIKPQTLRHAMCTNGHYMGIAPAKLPNRLLAWPRREIEALLRGLSNRGVA